MSLVEILSAVDYAWNFVADTCKFIMGEYFNFLVYIMRWLMHPDAMQALKIAGIVIAVWLVLYLGHGLAFFRFIMRWLQRVILFIGLCVLGVWLFYAGREHQIFLDNKTLGDYRALDQVNVSINGERAVELMARDRDMRKAIGPKFEIKAEIFDEDGEITDTITKTIAIEFSKDIMINLPALAGGAEEFLVPAPR